MAKYVVEGLIKEIEHDRTGIARLRFIPDTDFAIQHNGVKFVAFQPLPPNASGMVFAYDEFVEINNMSPQFSFRVGKVRFELEYPKKNSSKTLLLKGNFVFAATTRVFQITKTCEIWS